MNGPEDYPCNRLLRLVFNKLPETKGEKSSVPVANI